MYDNSRNYRNKKILSNWCHQSISLYGCNAKSFSTSVTRTNWSSSFQYRIFNNSFKTVNTNKIFYSTGGDTHIRYILIDEMSFIGQNLLETIDFHLKQAFPENADKSYAGLSIILVGDLGQLPQGSDKPTYASQRRAKLLWQEFKTIVTLDKIFRQDGQDKDQERFHELLTNLRDANPKIDDWNLLMMRIPVRLDTPTNDDFNKEVHLFSTNDNVHNHNRRMLHSLGYPVAPSLATKAWNGNLVKDASIDELDLQLLISKDSRVMLTTNFWIEVGLVNGALRNI